MKCPKCDYLGFETGDRCKNCGYDFSLLADTAAAAAPALAFDGELSLRPHPVMTPGADAWLDQLDTSLISSAAAGTTGARTDDVFDISLTPVGLDRLAPDPIVPEVAPAAPVGEEPEVEEPEAEGIRDAVAPQEAPASVPSPVPTPVPTPVAAAPALPLFTPFGDDDRPLITLPAAPRPPLSVRRTPDLPRLRAVPRPLPRPEPVLAFVEERDEEIPAVHAPIEAPAAASRVWRGAPSNGQAASGGRRLGAAVIDHAILLTIDFVVIYFTLRMVSLELAAWGQLPPLPLAAFLLLIKLTYFCAFTAVGGQTIGKMATRIRVVTEQHGELDGAQAVRRTLAGALSTVAFGLGFLPGVVGDGRALHDRAARTRVVGLEPA